MRLCALRPQTRPRHLGPAASRVGSERGWKEQPIIEPPEEPRHLEAVRQTSGEVEGGEVQALVKTWDPTRGEYDWFVPLESREDRLGQFQRGPDFDFTENHHWAQRTYPSGGA